MRTFYLDGGSLNDVVAQMTDKHVAYGLGAKAPRLSADPSEIKRIDCSGYVRYLIYQATNGQIIMPDGSYIQRKWCREQGFDKCDYSECAQNDGWIRIGFYAPTKSHPGHVWMILNGQTLESSGKTGGPGSMSWRDRAPIANACYKLAQTYSITVGPITSGDSVAGTESGASAP